MISVPQDYNLHLNIKEKFILHYTLFAIGYLFYSIISILFNCLHYLSTDYITGLSEKTQSITEQFQDVLYSVSASISTGRQMTEALYEAEQNMRLIRKRMIFVVIELYHGKRLCIQEPEEDVLKVCLRTVLKISQILDIYLTCRKQEEIWKRSQPHPA